MTQTNPNLSMRVPFSIAPFEQHNSLKQTLLDQITSQEGASQLLVGNTNITNCDWQHSCKEGNREWVKTIVPHLASHILSWTSTIGFNSFIIRELWFQQYGLGGQHDWHIHGCNWTGVYFLNIPQDEALQTQFKDPVDINKICKFDVKEGDILMFPSFVIHKAPRNNTTVLKTIISWNMDVALSAEDLAYGQ